MVRYESEKSLSPWVADRNNAIKLAKKAYDDLNQGVGFMNKNGQPDFRVEKIKFGNFKDGKKDLRFNINRDQPLSDTLEDFVVFLYALNIPDFYPARDFDVAVDTAYEEAWAYDDYEHMAEVSAPIFEANLDRDSMTICENVLEILYQPKEFFWTNFDSENRLIRIMPQVEEIGGVSTQTILHAYGIFLDERQKMVDKSTQTSS